MWSLNNGVGFLNVFSPAVQSICLTILLWCFSLIFQGKYAEAEPLYERCQAIQEKTLGPKHPKFAATLNNRAGLFKSQVRAKICWMLIAECFRLQF